MIHLLRGFYHESIVARRLGIAVGEYHLFVVAHYMVNAEAFCLHVIELTAQRHKKFAHLLAERGDFLFAVVRASLLEIADGNVILVAEVSAHLIAYADKLAPDFLQTRLVALVKL